MQTSILMMNRILPILTVDIYLKMSLIDRKVIFKNLGMPSLNNSNEVDANELLNEQDSKQVERNSGSIDNEIKNCHQNVRTD